MKLGSSCKCPTTGVRGTVVRFIGETPVGRAPDGRLFKVRRDSRGRKTSYFVRVLDEGMILTNWMRATLVEGGKYRVLHDPLWARSELDASEVEVMEDDE